MGTSWKESTKEEIRKTEPVPYERIAQDLAQGYLLSHPLEGRITIKYKVVKSIGGEYFQVILADHDIMTGVTPGVTLFIFKTDSEGRTLDGFSLNGGKKQDGSYGFWEDDPFRKPRSRFWKEYSEAKVDEEATRKQYESDKGIRNATVAFNPPQIQLALDTPTIK